MKETKNRFELFSFYDHTGIAEHLTEMAEKGWLIEKISGFGWTYRRIVPRKMKFVVSYYPKASEFDSEPSEGQKTFYEFCEHTGWVLAAASAQMQIFYHEQEHPTPIATEPALELETIHAAAKRGYLPAYFVLLLLSVVNGIMYVFRLRSDFIDMLSSSADLFTGFAWLLCFLMCVVELCGYFLWYSKAKRAAERGEFMETSGHCRMRKVLSVIGLAGVFFWIVTIVRFGSSMLRAAGLSMMLYVIVLVFLGNGIREVLKRKKVSRSVNCVVTMCCIVLLSFGMMGIITFGILHASRKGLFDRGTDTYEYNGTTFTVYMDELPLTVEELTGVSCEGYSKEQRSRESLLLERYVMRQQARFDQEDFAEMPGLDYTITEVKMPFLYAFCRKSLLDARKDETEDGQVLFTEHYEASDPEPWQAKEAYRLRWGDGYLNQYLLCYEDRIIEISLSWEPTAEQMGIAARKLTGL